MENKSDLARLRSKFGTRDAKCSNLNSGLTVVDEFFVFIWVTLCQAIILLKSTWSRPGFDRDPRLYVQVFSIEIVDSEFDIKKMVFE